ncbi:oxidoreductase ion channel protein IolS [Paenibacillus sp. J31TS4]|uniref:aldo/keto reductase n=1 Tax=Paenibacillus sp. J31TS4 TaxID=2807195 RepID=UPI001AFE3C1E|nr:aldo/keto reductase [Paenibacillus sp. J31TS4]GIP39390.1 oxidoreductase ion channel protein IolS [Paenibacillus sp. J31TS4]
MQYTQLGRTDLRISRIGLGTNAVGGHNLFAGLKEDEGMQMVERALSDGVTFLDTADVYGGGRSEELVGQVLTRHKSRRAEIVLATKGGRLRRPDGTPATNNDPAYLRSALETSLRRLQTEYIDLYYLHYPDGVTPFAESIGELTRLQEEGKIREIGLSNVTLEQLEEASRAGRIAALQSPYHMLDRSAERELLPYCVRHGISFVPYGPLAFGILGGRYDESFRLEAGDWRSRVPLFAEGAFKRNLKIVERLREIAEAKGGPIGNLALAWLLAQDGVDAVIPGGKRPEQAAENALAGDLVLTPEDLAKIEGIIGQ